MGLIDATKMTLLAHSFKLNMKSIFWPQFQNLLSLRGTLYRKSNRGHGICPLYRGGPLFGVHY